MLVYLKESMAYTTLDGIRIYGKNYCRGKFGPVDLPRDTYEKYKEILEDAPYTPKWLSKRFGKPFNHPPFRACDIRSFDFEKLIDLALYLDIKYSRDGRLEPSVKEKNAIVKSILSRL